MNKIVSVSAISPFSVHRGWGAMLVVVTTMLLCTAATAVAVDREFNIDAQRTDSALLQLAEAADVQIVFAATLAQQTNSPMIAGTQSVEQALDLILEGTQLQYEFASADLVVVTALQPTMAQGAGGAASATSDGASDEPVELAPTVTIGSRVEQDMDDVIGSVSVMTSEEIRKQMVSDMSDLFRYEPGIQITGRKGGAQNFIVRGMGADRILMIKDGVRMNEGYGADGLNDIVGRGFIDVDTIKQVEVAKGAVSALFGADALGGVVNFTTKDPIDYLQGDNTYLSVNVENDSRSTEWGAGVTGAIRVGIFDFSLSTKYRDSDEPKNFAADLNPASIETSTALFKAVWNITEQKSLKFTYDYYEQEVERPDDGEDKGNYLNLTFGGDWSINSQTQANQNTTDIVSLKYRDEDTSWGGVLFDTLDLSVDYNETVSDSQRVLNHEYPEAFAGFPDANRDLINDDSYAQEILSFTSILYKEFNSDSMKQEISYGIDYSNTLSNRPRKQLRILSDGTITLDEETATFPENDTVRVGAYLQDRIEMMDGRLAVTPGLRYSYYKVDPSFDQAFQDLLPDPTQVPESISESNVSASLGISYEISDDLRVTAQWAQGFKVPPYDLALFFFTHTPFGGANAIRTVPNGDLDPETSDSYELGLKGTAGDFTYDIAAYLTDYDDFITIAFLETVSEPGLFGPQLIDVTQYQNIDSVRIKGAEIKLTYSVTDNIGVFLNGAYIDGEDRTTGDYIRDIVPLSGNLGIEYTGLNGFARTVLRMADDMRKFNEGDFTTAGYAVLDVMGGLNVTENLQLNFSVLNILDTEYLTYSSIGGVPDDGRDLSRSTQPGRSISARISYEF